MPRSLLPQSELRRKVEIYLSRKEHAAIQRQCYEAGLSVSAFIRRAALGQRVPPPIPQPNAEKWAELARLAANLNQLARAVQIGRVQAIEPAIIQDIGRAVQSLRTDLLGVAGDRQD